MNKKLLVAIATIVPLISEAVDVKQKTAVCATCHGEKGISSSPLWPNLAGQKKEYLEKQLRDFKNDLRKDPVMTPQAKSLSDEEINALAKYYSELKGH